MDSPTELSDYTLRSFKVRNPDGKEDTIDTAVHHDGDPSAIDDYAAGTEKKSSTRPRRSSASSRCSTPALHVPRRLRPVGGGDGMEHRNSTVVASPTSFEPRRPCAAR